MIKYLFVILISLAISSISFAEVPKSSQKKQVKKHKKYTGHKITNKKPKAPVKKK